MRATDPASERFAALVRPHLDRLYRLAYRLTGNRGDAEDLLQDVLCKVYERRDELTSITELGPWLGRVLYNRFVDDTRKHARKRFSTVDPDSLAAVDAGDADRTEPESAAATQFSITAVQAALAKLSIEHRTVLMMHDGEGYKLVEIQSITGVSLGTLKSRLHRARTRLRELLRADGTFSDASSF